MGQREDEFETWMGSLNLRGPLSELEYHLKLKDYKEKLKSVTAWHATFIQAAQAVHRAGKQVKKRQVDCQSIRFLLNFTNPPPEGLDTQPSRLLELMKMLSDARDEMMKYYNSTQWDLDDDGVYERYKNLAMLTARTVHAYHREIYKLERYAGRNFEVKIVAALAEFGCGQDVSSKLKVLPANTIFPEKERIWKGSKQ